LYTRLKIEIAGQGCRARLPGKAAGQGCRARLPGKAAGQGCRARLPGKAAGQGCRARLPGKAAGQGCWAKVQAMVQYAESIVKLDNNTILSNYFCFSHVPGDWGLPVFRIFRILLSEYVHVYIISS
jgi:hypothetical protein